MCVGGGGGGGEGEGESGRSERIEVKADTWYIPIIRTSSCVYTSNDTW